MAYFMVKTSCSSAPFLVIKDVSFDNGGVFYDFDIADFFGFFCGGIFIFCKKEPQSFALCAHLRGQQRVIDNHVAGVVVVALHIKLTLSADTVTVNAHIQHLSHGAERHPAHIGQSERH